MITHVTNCCAKQPQILGYGKTRPACGREILSGCEEVENKGLNNSILDEIWSKPVWYHSKFDEVRNSGQQKPQKLEDYEAILGNTLGITDHFTPYHKTSCDLIYDPTKTTNREKYNPTGKAFKLNKLVEDNGLSADAPCVYPNCWLNAAETNKAICSNKFYKIIAHYPSVGRPFQTATSSSRSQGLQISHISPDSIPGKQLLYVFDSSTNEIEKIEYKPKYRSHDKNLHTNTAYPGKYWISWWNGINPGNIIGFDDGTNDTDNIFRLSPLVQNKLSDQIKCEYDGNVYNSNSSETPGPCGGLTFIKEFQTNVNNNIIKSSTGFNHSCILTEDYHIFCWGITGDVENRTKVPYEQLQELREKSIYPIDINCGGDYTIATLSNGTLIHWGDNSFGQGNIPNDLVWNRNVENIKPEVKLKKIATGGFHVVALFDSDTRKTEGEDGITYTVKNSIRIWGDERFGKTIIPKKWSGNKPLSMKDRWYVGSDFSKQIIAKSDTIIPLFDLVGSTLSQGKNPKDIVDLILNSSYTKEYSQDYNVNGQPIGKGIYRYYSEFEKTPDRFGVYPTVTKELEYDDVFAGRHHTIGILKTNNNVYQYQYSTVWDNAVKDGRKICDYSGKLEYQFLKPISVEFSGITYFDYYGFGTCPECFNDSLFGGCWTNAGVNVDVDYHTTGIFTWGAGNYTDEKPEDITQSDWNLIKYSSNLDYRFFSNTIPTLGGGLLVKSGQSFQNIKQRENSSYYFEVSPSSAHSLFLAAKTFIISRYNLYGLNLHGWGTGVDNYIYNLNWFDNRIDSNFLPKRKIVNQTEYIDPYEITNYYYVNFFTIDLKNINFRINLYKKLIDNSGFYEILYKNNPENLEIKIDQCDELIPTDPCSNLGGWTFGNSGIWIGDDNNRYSPTGELDLNRTNFDKLPLNEVFNENRISIKAGKGRTILIERIKDLWNNPEDSPKTKAICYGDCGNANLQNLIDAENEIEFFGVGDNHHICIQRKTNNEGRERINFPLNPDLTTPFGYDQLVTTRVTQTPIDIGVALPEIKVNMWSKFKNGEYLPPVFDIDTSSRMTYTISLNIKKEKYDEQTKTYKTIKTLNIRSNPNESVNLIGLRGDQRVKPFTGATCDCMWSDWATDHLKIGGHQGVILNYAEYNNSGVNGRNIPYDAFAGVPDRELSINSDTIENINYYAAPPNVLTHNIIELPPGKFPSQLAFPCREKFCEGGVNYTIQNWCDPCAGKYLPQGELDPQKAIWASRLGCTGCAQDYNSSVCNCRLLENGTLICSENSPKIRENTPSNSGQIKINSFGEKSTPIEEAWPSLNRYLIPRWTDINSEGVSGNAWFINEYDTGITLNSGNTFANLLSLTAIDYPLVVVPSHGGDIGEEYDMEAAQEISLAASLGDIDKELNTSDSTLYIADGGVRYITDFKDTEYPFMKKSPIYPDFTPPNLTKPIEIDSIFFPAPDGVSFDIKNLVDKKGRTRPLCGNTETGCSSCSIPFTGAEVAAWGFDLYVPEIVNKVKNILGIVGDPEKDIEIGNVNDGGAWIGIAKDRLIQGSSISDIKDRIRIMMPITLQPGETIKFGVGVRQTGMSETYLNGGIRITVNVDVNFNQYPNDRGKISSTQKYENYKYRWGRFNDECACSSRIKINSEIFSVPNPTPTVKKLQEGKINDLTKEEKADIIIGGKLTAGLGLLQYWNCDNPVTYLESGETSLLNVSYGMGQFVIGLSDLDNKRANFIYETQEFIGDGANFAFGVMDNNPYYRGENNVGFVDSQECLNPPNCTDTRFYGVSSPGTRGIWSHWLSSKGWSNFFTNNNTVRGDDPKDRVGGDIPFESSHPQGWLGLGSVLPHIRTKHKIATGSKINTHSASSLSDFTSQLKNFHWGLDGFSGSNRNIEHNTQTSTFLPLDNNYACENDTTHKRGNSGRVKGFNQWASSQSRNALSSYKAEQNPKTQKLKTCCFGSGYEHEVYSSVSGSFIPDKYSRMVKLNKYRNLYNAMWHAHPRGNLLFRKWHGDPYSPGYCEPGNANCHTPYMPIWIDYYYPDKLTNGTDWNIQRNILHWRHRRWNLPMFIGVNSDNVGNFYIQFRPEYDSGYELIDLGFQDYAGRYRIGWDYRSFDSISAQTKLQNSLYFYKSNRGAIGSVDTAFGRGNNNFNKVNTFYSMNSNVWMPDVSSLCIDDPIVWGSIGLLLGGYGGFISDYSYPSWCFGLDNSTWNLYFTNLGPGFIGIDRTNPQNLLKADFTPIK